MSPRAAWRLESFGFKEVYDYVEGKKGWFDAGLPMEGAVEGQILLGQRARRDVPTARMGESVGAVAQRARAAGWDEAAVTNEANILLGWLGHDQLDAPADTSVEELMLEGPVTFRPSMAIDETAGWLASNNASSVVVTSSDGTLIGVARPEDLL